MKKNEKHLKYINEGKNGVVQPGYTGNLGLKRMILTRSLAKARTSAEVADGVIGVG